LSRQNQNRLNIQKYHQNFFFDITIRYYQIDWEKKQETWQMKSGQGAKRFLDNIAQERKWYLYEEHGNNDFVDARVCCQNSYEPGMGYALLERR
jgi:hypothetical protein